MNHEDKKAVCSIDAFTWQAGLVRGDDRRNTLRIVHRREEQKGFICLVSHTCFTGQSSRSIDSLELAGPSRPQFSPSNPIHFCCCSQSSFSNRTTYSIAMPLPKVLHGSSASVLPAPGSSLKHFLAYPFCSSQVF